MRRFLNHIILLSVMTLFLLSSSLLAKSFVLSPHGDKSKLPKGCWSCHRGHGVKNTPMLPDDKATFCFRCHGDSITRAKTRAKGDLSSAAVATNLSREFEKPYRHPVEKTGIHRYDEILPETEASAPRHAECVDCHHHHYVAPQNKAAGIRGLSQEGAMLDRIQSEYELCFKCHSYSANLPADQTNKAELFSISNPSYHPVITQGKNPSVPSLLSPLTESSIIKCTDCHNNDDPVGPRGPHASNYKYILARNFVESDGNESAFQYDLCYGCHRRSIILGNKSFRYHNLHISEIGTSCRTCHNPHGSILYPHLLDFNNLNILPSNSGRLAFRKLGEKSGECFLNCHNKDHDPATYPINFPSSGSSQGSGR